MTEGGQDRIPLYPSMFVPVVFLFLFVLFWFFLKLFKWGLFCFFLFVRFPMEYLN